MWINDQGNYLSNAPPQSEPMTQASAAIFPCIIPHSTSSHPKFSFPYFSSTRFIASEISPASRSILIRFRSFLKESTESGAAFDKKTLQLIMPRHRLAATADYQIYLRRSPHAKSQNTRYYLFLRRLFGCFIHGNGASAARLLLPDEALLLPKHALLQESESRLLQRQTRQGRMLLQGWFVSHAAQVSGHDN